jgi:hypothetical protein
MQSEPLDVLLGRAKSMSWEARAGAASALASRLDSDEAAQAMLDLLRDPDDTAVGEAALGALLGRGDQRAADIVFVGVATATDDVAEHLLYFIAREQPREPAWSGLVGFARSRAIGPPGPVKEGATAVLDSIGADAPRDG